MSEVNSPDDGPFKERFEIEVAVPATDAAPESPFDLVMDAEAPVGKPAPKRGRKPKADK